MKDPRELPMDYTPPEPKILRHWRVMAKLSLHRRNMIERRQARAALANKGLASGCR